MITILEKILWIFIIIAIGFFLNKKNFVPYESNEYLINILLKLTCPCMIFQALATRQLTDGTLRVTILTLAGSLIFFIVMDLLGYVLAKGFAKKDLWVYAALMTGVNTGFMGFPITKAIFGDDMFYLIVIQNVALAFFLYLMMPLQFSIGQKERPKVSTIFNPCMIGTLLGVVFLFGSIPLPAMANSGIKMIGDMTTPLSMLVVGIELGNSKVGQIIKDRKLRLTAYIKMLGAPLLTLAIVYFIPMDDMVKAILVFSACFPSAVVTVAMASKYGKNSKLAAEGVALTVLISLVTIPLWAMVVQNLFI
ncbi:MAG: AEC family transporter [Clostridia bacterium]|nr:AEC family transporter [Clostridia bacterium]